MAKIVYKKIGIDDLIKYAQHGDIKALEELIRKIQKSVYAMFFHLADKKEDVSDLTQETLVKMAKNIKNLKDTSYFKNWLNKIITNTYNDYMRRRKDKIENTDPTEIEEIKDKIGCEPGEKCLFAEADKLIKSAILTLPHALRISIILREYEGLSYDDISKITNTPVGTVKSRISRARIKLHEALKEFI